MKQVIYHVADYIEEPVYEAVGKALEQLDVLSDLNPDMKVLLKPNLIMARKATMPITTHPLIVKSVARWLQEHGITNIIIGESSGGPFTAEHMKTIYQTCGMHDAEPYATLNMDFGFQSVQ